MKKQYSMIALCLALFAGTAFAAGDAGSTTASGAKPKGKQQTRMAACNKDAKEKALKGAERKQFMSTCLKAKA